MPDSTKAVPQPSPNENLVKVFDTEQETEAMVVKGLLESAGIDADLKSINAMQDSIPESAVQSSLCAKGIQPKRRRSSRSIASCHPR